MTPTTGRRADRDTQADDCALDFLRDLDESLWILEEARRAAANAFRHSARGHDHVAELRRLLRRLHAVLVDWEVEIRTGADVAPGGRDHQAAEARPSPSALRKDVCR
ncbi:MULTISPECIES: hypothetical protein [Thermomonosporaceae]|uniref:hypothetical protein n=1 Tax=Thermomonosporaceae TaxID=2012 RepID=UPI00255B060E|nr:MULTISPECIES: hypothetical protein [Thermomonosporaceae]MDL4772357.1 hypothetical protein [Actinomadura xylanilytica]